MSTNLIFWLLFIVFIILMLLLDLGLFNRKHKEASFRESLFWSIVWTLVALLFNLGIYLWMDKTTAINFFTGYLIERSMSMDNLFVFLAIFSYFKVPGKYQHKVLFWGIAGALLMRLVFILAGITLINMFHWVLYLLGLFLIFTGIKLALPTKNEFNPEKNLALRIFKSFMPVVGYYQEEKFFIKKDFRYYATPLFIALIIVETSDVVFAVDSIPAILGITTDPFVVYTSNIFAIFGLRALYFVIAEVMKLFRFLNFGLSLILVFIGAKMLLEKYYPISVETSLLVIATLLVFFIFLSLVIKEKSPTKTTEI